MKEITVQLFSYDELSPAVQEKVRDWFREGFYFIHFIFSICKTDEELDSLQKIYEYQIRDEQVAESIRANEYYFTKEGEFYPQFKGRANRSFVR